jgi:hypothetical protein
LIDDYSLQYEVMRSASLDKYQALQENPDFLLPDIQQFRDGGDLVAFYVRRHLAQDMKAQS